MNSFFLFITAGKLVARIYDEITGIQKEQLDEFFNSKKDFFLKTKRVDYKKMVPELTELAEKVQMTEFKVKRWICRKRLREKCKNSETDNVVAGPSTAAADEEIDIGDCENLEPVAGPSGVSNPGKDSETDDEERDFNEAIKASMEENYKKTNSDFDSKNDKEGKGKEEGNGKKSS